MESELRKNCFFHKRQDGHEKAKIFRQLSGRFGFESNQTMVQDESPTLVEFS